jgi:tetratricopeptide (TPR) repeat protein
MRPTPKLPKIAYFWPGLPQLWLRGSWAGLVIAVGFTALVNLLILATCVFHEWIPLEYQLGGGAIVAASWLVGWWQSRRAESAQSMAIQLTAATSDDESDTVVSQPAVGQTIDRGEQLYRDAQQAYLRGDWVAAEQLLLKLLKLDDRDAEARLMLATLWRHQGRHREAVRQLDKLSRLEAADPWQYEIAVERQENAAALTDQTETNETSEASKSNDETESNDEIDSTETQTLKITDAESSATEIAETKRRHAA